MNKIICVSILLTMFNINMLFGQSPNVFTNSLCIHNIKKKLCNIVWKAIENDSVYILINEFKKHNGYFTCALKEIIEKKDNKYSVSIIGYYLDTAGCGIKLCSIQTKYCRNIQIKGDILYIEDYNDDGSRITSTYGKSSHQYKNASIYKRKIR